MAEKGRRHVHRSHVDVRQPNAIVREVDDIIARAEQLELCIVTLDNLVFFSTHSGDAWLLDPASRLALQLASEGSRVPVTIIETADRFVIEWRAEYSLRGSAFVVNDASGQRLIYGYPVEELVQAQP
jgi:hypothetical protein